MQFTCDHGGLHVLPFLSQEPLITNDPLRHPCSIGLPGVHPPLTSLLGMPIFYGDECVGVMEIANRKEGYQADMISVLKPFCNTVSLLLALYSQLPARSLISSSVSTSRLDIRSAELSATVIQSISDGIVVTDSDFIVQLINNGASRMLGLDDLSARIPSAIGRSVQEIVSPLVLDQVDWVKIANESPHRLIGTRGEGYVRDHRGVEIPVLLSISSFLFITRRYFCFIFSDMRDRRNYEEKIRFLAFLSHELRNPAQVLVTGLQELLPHQTNTNIETEVNALIDASKMVTRIVNNVLHLSKLESGKVSLEEETCSIRDVLERVAAMMRPQRRSTEILLSSSVDVSVPERVYLDRGKFEQILVNLVSNALKHTTHGTVQIRAYSTVLLAAEHQQDRHLHVEVSDTGSGIKSDDIPKLFHLYQVLDAPSHIHSPGTGLGLVIAKQYCQILGGDISVRSEYGRGSTFDFWVRFSILNPDADADTSNLIDDNNNIQGQQILIVDDNASVRKVIIRALTRAGCVCFEAENGQQALSVLRQEQTRIAAVLLDCLMPVMDGYATATAIRKELRSDVPIVGLTGCTAPADLERCLAAGFNSCLIKPVNMTELCDTLRRMIKNAHVKRKSSATV